MAKAASPRRRAQGWGSTAMVIGALGIVGLALLVVPGWIAPAPSSEPLPSASPSVDVSFPESAFRSVEWRISALGADSEGAGLAAIVVADQRLVTVGSRDRQPVAWWSDDGGETWTAATTMAPPDAPPAEGAVAAPRTAAASGQRVVAAGFWVDPVDNAILGPVVWVSPDGRTWSAHDLSAEMPGVTLDRIVGTPDGFLAIGFEADALGWWQSADGATWEPVDLVGLPDLAVLPPAVTWTPDALIVAGGQGGSTTRPGIWAADWTILQFEEVFDQQAVAGWITAIARADYGFVAVGQTLDDPKDPTQSHLAAWISADGRNWQSLALETPVGTGAGSVAANQAGAVIIGGSTQTPATALWFLPGGAGSPSEVPLPFYARDVVALSDRFVIAGICPPTSDCTEPMIGIGTPSELADAAAPTLPPSE